MSRALLLCASSKLATVFRSYGRLFQQQFPFFLRLSLSCNAGSGIHQTCNRYRARPTVYHVMPSVGCCSERLQQAAFDPASHPTSWLTTMLRLAKTQHLAEKLCKGAVLAFESLNNYIKFSLY